jgi:ABC-2 type transport system permease protein
MTPTLLIAKRELGAYLRSWTGYIIIGVVLSLDGLLFNAYALGGPDKRSAEVLGLFFYFSSGVVIASSIFVSMRLIAEERQTGTVNLLYSSPITDQQIVLGKYLSALAFLAIMTLATFYMPMLILVNGKISWGHVGAGYLGLLLLGSACLAIGTFGSALARSQVVAVVLSGVMVVALLVCWFLARVTERPLNDIFSALALHGTHFQPFQQGIVHVRDVVYYLAVTYVALFGATRVLEARRWR